MPLTLKKSFLFKILRNIKSCDLRGSCLYPECTYPEYPFPNTSIYQIMLQICNYVNFYVITRPPKNCIPVPKPRGLGMMMVIDQD